MVSKIKRMACLLLDADHLIVRITDVSEKPQQGSRYSNWARGCMVKSSNPSKTKRFIFSPKVQTGPLIQPKILFNWYRGSFPGVKRPGPKPALGDPGGRGVKLTTHLYLVPMLGMSGAIILLPNTPST